jgi:hypothetical protein
VIAASLAVTLSCHPLPLVQLLAVLAARVNDLDILSSKDRYFYLSQLSTLVFSTPLLFPSASQYLMFYRFDFCDTHLTGAQHFAPTYFEQSLRQHCVNTVHNPSIMCALPTLSHIPLSRYHFLHLVTDTPVLSYS